MLDLDNLHLVELVQAVEAAHVLAVRAGLATEAGGVGAVLDGEVAGLEDGVTVNVGDGHLGGGDQVEVVEVGVVHLSFLVGQLAGGVGGGLVHHIGRLHLGIAVLGGGVEEEVDEGALHLGPFALVNGEAGAGDLAAQVEVNDVVLFHQFPVGECGLRHIAGVTFLIDHLVVFCALSERHGSVRHVRQQHHHAADLLFLFG